MAVSPSDKPSRSPRRLQRRRVLFFTVVFAVTVLGVATLGEALAHQGLTLLEGSLLALFAVLFYHLTFACGTAVLGFLVEWRGRGDPLRLDRSLPAEEEDLVPLASTAIAIPIYNEDVTRVFEGVRIMFRSLERTGHLGHFDFFILSDSDDINKWVEEEVAWLELCRQLNGFGRIFYRKRRQAINRKSGNIADFCRRWGARYRYMVVLDADSLMGGEGLVRLVRLMERNPGVGILQTAPRIIAGETPLARVLQFSMRLYGPLFAAGMSYWQGGDGSFWGHNAIVRLAPFMENCGLPKLPGEEPMGGHILSHDYVEAALMRRAGYAVCLAQEIEETYEEGPPGLIDYLKRDRRWCQGNLQHTWLLFAKGWSGAHRLALFHGILNYLVSPVWFLFLILGTFYAFGPRDLTAPANQGHYLLLLAWVAACLFVPKLLVLGRHLLEPDRAAAHGGRRGLLASAALETALFTLLAPILMVSHARFVVLTLLGQGVRWAGQRRQADGSVDWREAILGFWKITLFGLLWGISTAVINFGFFLWLSPVLAGLVLSIPFHILVSEPAVGAALRRWHLFLTPEETRPPWLLRQFGENLAKAYRRRIADEKLRPHDGLMQVLLDPYINALHVSLLRLRTRPVPESAEFFERKCEELLAGGPGAVDPRDQLSLLYHPESVLYLNDQLWSRPSSRLDPWWNLALRQYNLVSPEPVTPLYR